MECSDNLFVLLELIEQFGCFRSTFHIDFYAFWFKMRQCVLRNFHKTCWTSAHNQNIGLCMNDISKISDIKLMAFFPPPGCIYLFWIDNYIWCVSLAINGYFSERIMIYLNKCLCPFLEYYCIIQVFVSLSRIYCSIVYFSVKYKWQTW